MLKDYKQRLVNCKCMLRLAWTALWFDSRAFAIVLLNSFREERESIIGVVDFKDGSTYNQYGTRIKRISSDEAVSPNNS